MRTYPLFLLLLLSFSFACGNNETAPKTTETPAAQAPALGNKAASPALNDQPEATPEPAPPVATQVAKEKENNTKTMITEKPTARKVAQEVTEHPGEETALEAPQPAPDLTTEEPTPAPPVQQKVQVQKPAVPAAPSHAIWDGLLRKYVNHAGRVNYAGLKKEEAKLDEYLALLSKNPPQNTWSRAEQMAFWINAYNAFTVKLILDNYPVSSITKLNGGQPWELRWVKIGSKTYTLNEIENSILRPKFKDARIHFAVNCAAKSCPPLLNQAWTAQNLESNFEKQARAFINNPAYNKITPSSVQVSKIFQWYAEDFGNLIAFLNRYSKVKISPGAKVSFLEYDWALNSQ